MVAIDRPYFQRRAHQEIESAMRADCVEAEIAHSTLAGLHLRRCGACTVAKTRECRDCILANIC